MNFVTGDGLSPRLWEGAGNTKHNTQPYPLFNTASSLVKLLTRACKIRSVDLSSFNYTSHDYNVTNYVGIPLVLTLVTLDSSLLHTSGV